MSLRTDAAGAAIVGPEDGQPRSDWTRITRILVATDGSPSSANAIALAAELASDHRAELVVVHVVPTLDLIPAGLDGTGAAFPHEPTEYDHVLLEDAAEVAAARGVVATTALLRGQTAEEIVAYGESWGADLVVVGSRGHGAITSTLLGSVSLGVLRHSARSVVIVRGASRPDVGALAEHVLASG